MVGGGNGEGQQQEAPPWTAARPSISIPACAWMESSGVSVSPGPMTLLSSLFGDTDECNKSLSELLAGAAMVEHGEAAPPSGLMFTTLPPHQGHFGMTHQQALAQVSAQAVQNQAEHPFSVSLVPPTSLTQTPATTFTTGQQLVPPSESLDYSSHSEQRLQSSSSSSSVNAADKPNDDGYNWRKYGQKQVKGCEFPRSYYKCTYPSCPVKKKVERSLEGHVTAIIYRGEHSHQRPHPSKLTKDNLVTSNENSDMQEGISSHPMSEIDPEPSQAMAEVHVSGTSDSEEVGDHEIEEEEKNDEPVPKRRNTQVRLLDSHRTVSSEPRIIVQTTSEVDLLEDGYRWRKYGQKVVKGNPNPRSYYKCTTPGCNVRKHVERVSTDPKAVMTTYEGKHNHEVPAAKTNSHTLANNSASQNVIPEVHNFNSRGVGGNEHIEQQPVAVARLKLKEDHIT